MSAEEPHLEDDISRTMYIEGLNDSIAIIDKASFKNFINWRSMTMKKSSEDATPSIIHSAPMRFFASLFGKKKEAPAAPSNEQCTCLIEKQPWKSVEHGIAFHVCDTHGKQFGIPSGPFWEDEIRVLTREQL